MDTRAARRTGAYAAAAEAQLTGRPGCCAGSSGPGHVHLINGLYDAQRSGAPVIAIASTIPSREFGTEYFRRPIQSSFSMIAVIIMK